MQKLLNYYLPNDYKSNGRLAMPAYTMLMLILPFWLSLIWHCTAQPFDAIEAFTRGNLASVNALLCWSARDLLSLVKAFPDTSCAVSEMDEKSLPSGTSELNAVIVMDLECNETWTFVENLNFSPYENMKWIFLNAEGNREERLLELLETQNLGPSTEIFMASENGAVKSGKSIFFSI